MRPQKSQREVEDSINLKLVHIRGDVSYWLRVGDFRKIADIGIYGWGKFL